MRRTSFDKHNNTKRNNVSNASYGLARTKDAEYKCSVTYDSLQEKNYLQRSVSADNVVIHSRGFKPSDRYDPVKRNFLENLTSRILHFDMESSDTVPINLQKLLTPASDSHELLQSKNKKMFASSYFYAPTHPTVEDQVELARRISHSLSDVKNVKSKGQSMYVNRKKRSVKWIHDGNGVEDDEESTTPIYKDKLPLKCVMNPCGKVLDIHGIQALGEEVNIAPIPKNPEKLFDIVRDLNNQRGRGAELFAKRRKRSEKWIVDQEQPKIPNANNAVKTPTYPEKLEINGNAKFMMPFSTTPRTPVSNISNIDHSCCNPFTMDSTNIPITDRHETHCNANHCGHPNEIRKIYLREIAVGTNSDFSGERSSIIDKSGRIIFESTNDRDNIVNRSFVDNDNKYISRNNYQPKKGNFCNAQNNNKKNARIQQHYGNKYNDNVINDKVGNKQPKANRIQSDNDENEYTPVPVKQLIQEFERTCRPVLQYKQISPKIIPIVQRCSLNNDIARFFKTRNPVKYDNEAGEYARARDNYRTPAKLLSPYNRQLYENAGENYEACMKLRHHCDAPLCNIRKNYRDSDKRQCNGYISTDETEYTSEDTDSELNAYQDAKSMDRGNSAPSALLNSYDSEYPSTLADKHSQERETVCSSGNWRLNNSETEVLPEVKSIMLSMVASPENISETKKHLRNTPVLDNLLGTVTPECKFHDINPELGNKLYEKNNYTGPKLASLHSLTNYNTAPRGWDQSLTFYRPIKFEKPQEIVYSDF